MTELRRLDPTDEVAFARWHAALLAADVAELGEAATTWTAPELAVTLAERGRRRHREAWGLWEADEVVCAGLVVAPLLDNLDSAEVHVATPPAHRRRGHATALLAHVEERARDLGRTRLDAECTWAHDAGADPAGVPGWELARRHGYRFGIGDVQRELVGHLDPEVLASLAAGAAPHHRDYTLRTWVGPVPEDLVGSWLALSSTLMTEAPAGEMQREADSVDVGAQRELEDLQVRQGRTALNAVALDAAGEVVAYTVLITSRHEPGRAYQDGTLVHRAHRGHRLGLALKVANHAQLQRTAPEITRVTTWNAEENAPMIAVNEALGFQPVARLAELQKHLG